MRGAVKWWLAMVVVMLGVGSVGTIPEAQRRGDAAEATDSDASAEIAKLRAELDQLRGRLPDHSHVMKDVGYHFTNLWFAAKAKNWPLAKFYLDEPDRTCGGLCVSSRCARRAVVISTSASFSTDWTAPCSAISRRQWRTRTPAASRSSTGGAWWVAIHAIKPRKSLICAPESRSNRK